MAEAPSGYDIPSIQVVEFVSIVDDSEGRTIIAVSCWFYRQVPMVGMRSRRWGGTSSWGILAI